MSWFNWLRKKSIHTCRYCPKTEIKSTGMAGNFYCPDCNTEYYYHVEQRPYWESPSHLVDMSRLESIYFRFKRKDNEIMLYHDFRSKKTKIVTHISLYSEGIVDADYTFPLAADNWTPHNVHDKYKTILVFS